MNAEPPKAGAAKDSPSGDLSAWGTSAVIFAASGVPIPPSIVKSAGKAIQRIVGAGAEVPAAWMEAKAQRIRDATNARSLVTARAAELAAGEIGKDPAVVERAVQLFAAELVKRQENREASVRIAIDNLRENPPKEEVQAEPSDDWLTKFGRIAEDISDEQTQRYFGMLLAGEIRRPGSYAPATMQLLANLTPVIATTFAKLANLAVVFPVIGACVITGPYGNASQNGLAVLGFPFDVLTELQDQGLVKSDLTQHITFTGTFLRNGVQIGGRPIRFAFPTGTDADSKKVQLSVVRFTSAGQELCSMIEAAPNTDQIIKTVGWLATQWDVVPLF